MAGKYSQRQTPIIDVLSELGGYRGPEPKRRTYVPTKDQQFFLEDELMTRGLPYDHVRKIKFVEGLDDGANPVSMTAIARGMKAVTQGHTIYVQPGKAFEQVTSFEDDTPFEEVYHTVQFRPGGKLNFYADYLLRSLDAALEGRKAYDDNDYELAAKAEAKKMFKSYRAAKRERWGR